MNIKIDESIGYKIKQVYKAIVLNYLKLLSDIETKTNTQIVEYEGKYVEKSTNKYKTKEKGHNVVDNYNKVKIKNEIKEEMYNKYAKIYDDQIKILIDVI